MDIKTVGNNILIKAFDAPENKAGIIIPDDLKDAPIEGTVIAVGEGDDVVNVNKGDHVMFNPNKTIKITIQDVEYRIVKVGDVFVVLGD